jgi:hypothetical protein
VTLTVFLTYFLAELSVFLTHFQAAIAIYHNKFLAVLIVHHCLTYIISGVLTVFSVEQDFELILTPVF